MLLLPTILSDLPFGKPQGDYLADLLPQLAGLPGRPTYRHLARFGARCPHTHSRQAARPCDFAALNLAGLCAVVPYAHELAWAGDSTFIPKSGRKLPGVGYRWHSGEGRVAWGQQYELLSILDLKEHCSYPVHGCLQPVSAPRARPPRAEVGAMPGCSTGPDTNPVMFGTLLVEQRTAAPESAEFSAGHSDSRRLAGHGRLFLGRQRCDVSVSHWIGMILVSKLRRDAALWVPWTEPPTGRPGRPRKYAGHFDRARIGDLPVVELPDEGKRLYHAQLYYKPFGKLLRVVFVLDADEDPAAVARPTTLFATDPEMDPERIYRIYRDRFQIEFNFRDAKQHLGLAACQARTAERHHFHLNAVLATLAWTRLELRHAAREALDRFSMANVKLKNFLEMVLQRLFEAVGPDRTLRKCPEALQALLNLGQIEPQPT